MPSSGAGRPHHFGRPVYTEDVTAENLPHPLLRELYGYWRTLANSRPMPLAAEVDPLDIPKAVLAYVFLIDVEPDGRFRVRLAGTQTVKQSGLDTTGLYVDETPGAESVGERLAHAVLTGKPYHVVAPLTWSERKYKTYMAVMCPLASSDGQAVARFIGAAVFS